MNIEQVPLENQENEFQSVIYGVRSGDHCHSKKPQCNNHRRLNYFQDKNVDDHSLWP